MDQIVAWLLLVEKTAYPFDRFIDFSRLERISIRIGHVFQVARERSKTFPGAKPVKSAFFCDKVAGFATARLYETLMENTPIKAKAFCDCAGAAR